MDYTLLKLVHVGTVLVTLALFLLRGSWMLRDSPALSARWIRIVPHINDTLLIVAAIAMTIVAKLGLPPWILAKSLGLMAYIVLGTIALKRGRSKAVRSRALIGALLVFAYIVAVAVTKQALPGVA